MRSVVVALGTSEVRVDLVPISLPTPVAPQPLVPQIDAAAIKDRRPPEGQRPVPTWIPWGLGGGAAAALTFGIVETLRWQDGIAEFDGHKTNGAIDCQTSAPSRGGAGCNGIYDRYTFAGHAAIVGYAAAGVLGIGTALLVVADRSHGSLRQTAMICAPRTPAFLDCSLVF
jgi:hypothetical protein